MKKGFKVEREVQLVIMRNASTDTRIKTKSKGMTTGKLKIATKELLLAALEAIPERRVRAEAKPVDPKVMVIKKMRKSCMGLHKGHELIDED